MTKLTDDDALKLSYDLEGLADSLGALKRQPQLTDDDWARLNEAEGHLRDQAAILTTWAVGKTIDDATADLDRIRGAIQDAQQATKAIAQIAADVTKVAGVIDLAGAVIGLAGAITSGNVSAIANSVVQVGRRAAALT
jgi:hypothetical protein